jgi:hypothetical protein
VNCRTARCTRLVLSAALAAGLLVTGGCAQERQDAAATAPTTIAGQPARGHGEVPFEKAWEVTLPSRIAKSWMGEQIPDLLFVQVEGNYAIHCIEATSGATKWVSIPFARPITGQAFVQRVTLPGEREREIRVIDRLYMVIDDSLIALDIATGQVAWRYVLPFAPSTGPLAVGTGGALRVFLGDWNDRLQVVTLHPDKGFPYIAWQWPTAGTILAPGVESEELSYFTDSRGDIHCFKLDRSEVWLASTGGAIEGGAVLRDRVLYAGTESNALHALNRLTGEKLGQFNLAGPVKRRPFLFNGEPERMYVWTTSDDPARGGLWAVRAQPDAVLINENTRQSVEVVRTALDWYMPGATDVVASTPLNLLVTGTDKTLVWAVHRGNGKTSWAWDLKRNWPGTGAVDHVVTYTDRRDALRSLFACDTNGRLVSFRLFGFVPTPEEEAKGISSRAMANQKPGDKAEPKAEQVEKKPDAAPAP